MACALFGRVRTNDNHSLMRAKVAMAVVAIATIRPPLFTESQSKHRDELTEFHQDSMLRA